VKILHVSAGWEPWNGAANIARLIVGEQEKADHSVTCRIWAGIGELRKADEVWIHCSWSPCLWWAAMWGKHVRWVPEGSYDPVRLQYHAWKKKLVGPIERWFLRRCDKIVATCEAEKEWIEAYLGKRCPPIEVADIKRFFKISSEFRVRSLELDEIHLLYLGRRHPLKGLEYLEEAVRQLEVRRPKSEVLLRIVTNVFGEEKEKIWQWCDVLVLPTLSENFGLVVAEALERGKFVITTDGAPAWCDGEDYGGRLICLKGFRNGTKLERVSLLKNAIEKVGALIKESL